MVDSVALRPSRGAAAIYWEAVRPRQRANRHPLGDLLHLRTGDDVVFAVLPAHPCLRAAVVVSAKQHQHGGLTERGARLRTLSVEAPPDADESVVVPLACDGG